MECSNAKMSTQLTQAEQAERADEDQFLLRLGQEAAFLSVVHYDTTHNDQRVSRQRHPLVRIDADTHKTAMQAKASTATTVCVKLYTSTGVALR